MQRDGASGRAGAVAVAFAAAGLLIGVAAYIAADRKAAMVAPLKEAKTVAAVPAAQPSVLVRLVFEEKSVELPVDALTQAAAVIAVADQGAISVRGFQSTANDAALAEARTRAVVDLLRLAGVPPARIDLQTPEQIVASNGQRRAERVEISTK
jgi:hypothetical protein